MRSAGLRLIVLAGVAAGYFVAGKAGLSLAVVNASTTAVWPAAGIALAALLVFGIRVWPAVTVGAFLVNVTTSQDVGASLAIAAGNTLEAVAGAWAANRFARGREAFARTADLLRFSALSVLGAAAIAATIGTGALLAAGLASRVEAPQIWLTWWLGDAAGIMMVAPLVVLWFAPARQPWTGRHAIEAGALAATLVAVAWIVFGDTAVGRLHFQLQFLAIPLLLWAAFRFGGRETATAAALLGVFAIDGTLAGRGPFAGPSTNASLLTLQSFIGVITMVMLSVAAEVSGRGRVEREVRALNEVLEQRVAARTQELTRVHDRLIEAQQVAHIGSWEWDIAANTIWWSEELYRIYGLRPGVPVTYETFVSLVHLDDRDRIHAAVSAAAQDGRPFSFDHRIVRPDGAVRVLHGQGRVVRDEAGHAIRMVGTGHDVTERAAVEEQRAHLRVAEAARRDAEDASRAKDEFIAMLSHELRTPLNVALGWADLVRRESTLEARASRAVDTIYRNLQMLARLVSDLMDVSRIASRTLTLDVQPVDVADLVHGVVDAVRQTAASRAIVVDVSIASPVPVLQGDAVRLQQVLWNLLSNAVKFTREGGRVQLSAAATAGGVTIAIEDDGPGIPAAFLPHLFEPFRQADASVTRAHGGLGLGLSIARHLVQLHGGTIAAANRESGGAVFTVRLPAGVATA